MEKSRNKPKKPFSMFPWDWTEKPTKKSEIQVKVLEKPKSAHKSEKQDERRKDDRKDKSSVRTKPAPRKKYAEETVSTGKDSEFRRAKKVSSSRASEEPERIKITEKLEVTKVSSSPKLPVSIRSKDKPPSLCGSNRSSIPSSSTTKVRRYSDATVLEKSSNIVDREKLQDSLPATCDPLNANAQLKRLDGVNVPSEAAYLPAARARKPITNWPSSTVNRFHQLGEMPSSLMSKESADLTMDELDPLIASLEAFIKEQQTPFSLPEEEVIRYPVTVDPRQHVRVGRPALSSTARGRHNVYVDRLVRPEVDQTSKEWRAKREIESMSRVDKGGNVEQELENLKEQVRHLQRERESWLRDGERSRAGTDVEEFDSETENRYRRTQMSRVEPMEERRPGKSKIDHAARIRSQSENREKLRNPTNAPYYDRIATNTNGHLSATNSSNSSAVSASDEISVDDPYHYEDFTTSHVQNGDFDQSLSKLQDIVNELEGKNEKKSTGPKLNCCSSQSDRDSPPVYDVKTAIPKSNAKFIHSTRDALAIFTPPPIPKRKSGARSSRSGRHATISSASSKDILAAASRYSDEMYRRENRGSNGAFLHVPDEVSYDLMLRLDSPDKILIPERNLDFGDEREDEPKRPQRQMKAENIRRMLAVPPPGVTDREQRDREKLLLMTPILAREVTERSRKVAMQAAKRNAL